METDHSNQTPSLPMDTSSDNTPQQSLPPITSLPTQSNDSLPLNSMASFLPLPTTDVNTPVSFHIPLVQNEAPVVTTIEGVSTIPDKDAVLTNTPSDILQTTKENTLPQQTTVVDNITPTTSETAVNNNPICPVVTTPTVQLKLPENIATVVKTEHTEEQHPMMQEAGNDPNMDETVDDEAFDMDTSDSMIKVKTEMDFQISPASLPSASHSRTSSLSSKSSKTPSPRSSTSPTSQTHKSKKKRPPPPAKEIGQQDSRNDFYCWVCHKEGEVLCCELCPRVFHAKCLRMQSEPEGDWFCPECEKITEAECKDSQSKSMSQLSIQQLGIHLRYALQRMKIAGSEPFLEPVDTKKFSDYLDYVFHPMDISTLEKSVRRNQYGCTEAFLADVKWILHNCIIYNGTHTKLTHIAKTMVKIAQHEMSEIEVCPECYLNSCRKRENWFCEPCKDPHVLVWAKLQGFPHWPAKALRIDKGSVDARFFGQHDRAWIPLSGCYLMSKEMPHPVKNKKKGRGPGAKGGLDSAMLEAQHYIDNVIKKTGSFEYAPLRTPLTHVDLYRKSGTTDQSQDSGSIDNKEVSRDSKIKDNVSLKQEETDASFKSSVTNVKTALGEKLLNLKLGAEGGVPGSDLPKKKSKVVTTSGTHPGGAQKGGFAPKKRVTNPLLEKTIESCKASILDSLPDDFDDESSSEDSDSTSEEESNEASSNKSTPTINKDQTDNKEAKSEEGHGKVKGAQDDSDSELVMDIPEEEDGTKKKDSLAVTLADKGIVKLKKSKDGAKELKVSSKPKSILLNKDVDKRSSDPSSTPIRSSSSGNVKRKLAEDSPSSSPNVKVRKMDSGGGIKIIPAKEKKKIFPESSKSKSDKDGDSVRIKKSDPSKIRKDSIPGGAKKTEVIVKKKILMSNAAKPRADDGKDKSTLKSTAKILSQKMMNRKHEPSASKKPGEKRIGESEKSFFGDVAPKKLSSFTIPKHRPAPAPKHTQESSISKPVDPTAPSSNQRIHQPYHDNHNNHSTSIGANVPMQKIQKYNDKVMQGVQQVLVEMYEDMMNVFESNQGKKNTEHQGDATVGQQVTQLRLELERLKWMHQQEIAELQHNHDLTVAEIRQSLENEKIHALDDIKKKCDAEKQSAVEDTKKKQWCANCRKEAIFYCCWNTSYCDYPCQQLHWPKHMGTCSQARGGAAQTATTTAPSAEVEPAPEEEEPKSEAPKVQEEEDTMRVDEDEDDNSDNEMVIDENIEEATSKKVEDISPLSPEEELLKKSKNDLKDDQIPITSAEDINPTLITSSSISKVMSLPMKLKSSSPIGDPASTVVSSKLIDDIFSKVQKKEAIVETTSSTEENKQKSVNSELISGDVESSETKLFKPVENVDSDDERLMMDESVEKDVENLTKSETTITTTTTAETTISTALTISTKESTDSTKESTNNNIEMSENTPVETEAPKNDDQTNADDPKTKTTNVLSHPVVEQHVDDVTPASHEPEPVDDTFKEIDKPKNSEVKTEENFAKELNTDDKSEVITEQTTNAEAADDVTDKKCELKSEKSETTTPEDNVVKAEPEKTAVKGTAEPMTVETSVSEPIVTPVFSDNYLASLQAKKTTDETTTAQEKVVTTETASEAVKESPDSPEMFGS
nr:protein kinase C-binding protein 1-like [Ciona intestinalis]|eukprot:XP_009859278.2 protein kinase C-binding protein 1-like [Ciona intestinalis]